LGARRERHERRRRRGGASIVAEACPGRGAGEVAWCLRATRARRVAPGALNAENIGASAGEESEGPGKAEPSPLPARESSKLLAFLTAFGRFSRPHTVLGTAVSICSVSLLALRAPADLNARFALGLAQALSAALCMNVAIVGLNQLYDIEIDKVNKPYLPLASGDFTVRTGRAIVLSTAAVSLLIGFASGSSPLLATLTTSLLLGIAYSTDLPLLRWKRFPFLAAACILAVRAVIVQLGFFSHMAAALAGPATAASEAAAATMAAGANPRGLFQSLLPPGIEWTLALGFGTSFMTLFSIVIALFKDLPDIQGDREAGLKTMSVRLGPRRIFNACIALLATAYAAACAIGCFWCGPAWSRLVTVACHAALGATLLARSRSVQVSSAQSLYAFYMLIWKLFYAEYLLIPFIR